MSYRKSVAVGAREKKDRQYINFLVFKKNKRGEFQRRMLQIDATNNIFRNIKNFRESEKNRIRFEDLKLALPDDQNPLQLTIEFNNRAPFDTYCYKPSQRNELVTLINTIVKNTSEKKDTNLNINENLLREGGADYKKKTFGWDRRYLYLYPLNLHCLSQDNSDISRHAISLFATPISKEPEKLICIHTRLQPYTFRFDTVEQRDEWFDALIKASHNEGFEWGALSEDVNFSEEINEVKKELDGAVQLVRQSVAQKTALQKESAVVTRDLEAVKLTRSALMNDIEKSRNEKKDLIAQSDELRIRLAECKAQVEKALAAQAQEDALLQNTTSTYARNHEIFLAVQATNNLVIGDLNEVQAQVNALNAQITQLNTTLIDMQKSPELIEAQSQQTKREIDQAVEKTKAIEHKLAQLDKPEVYAEKIEQSTKRKDDSKKILDDAKSHLDTTNTDLQQLESAIAQLQQEVEHAKDKELEFRKEIQQLKDLTAAAEGQRKSFQQELDR